MSYAPLTRRFALLGAVCTLSGCSAVSALNTAAQPMDTYDLLPVAGSQKGRRTSRTLLVVRPQAPAALSTDRILVKPDAASITYLPDARWSDELPLVVQSLLIRSISGTGRIGYVGQSEGGPVPDSALLVRMDAFNVTVGPAGEIEVLIEMVLTILNDRDQRVRATRRFSSAALATSDRAPAIIAAFQGGLEAVLPQMASWAVQNV